MPAQQGTINVLGNAVFAALSLPVSAFTGIDDNHDGRLSQREQQAHADTLTHQITRRFRFYNGDQPGVVEMVMPMVDADERDSTSVAGGTHVLVLIKSVFSAPPTALRAETDVFGSAANERQLTIKATRGSEAEAAVLTPSRSEHRFFRAPWQVLRDYVVVGVEHILGGTDHLLFLLTIIVAAAGWKYWCGVLTSFTIAHSITLTLSMLGLVRVPASVVEPLIAASIVLMALLNLRQRGAPAQRISIVFACGLLHGLGFASSMADMGLHGAYRVASLVGFNVGIELGQAAFLVLVLTVGAALRALLGFVARTEWSAAIGGRFTPRQSYGAIASCCAAVVGSYWFLERIGISATLLAQAP